MAGVETILTLFILIGLGYVGKRTVLAGHSLAPVNAFVYYFAVPALLFNSVYKLSLDSLFQPYYLLAFLIAVVLTALIAAAGCAFFFSERNKEVLVIRALNGTFSNYAYMGIPLVFGLLGEAAYGAMISIILLGNVFQIGGTQFLIESQRQEGKGFKQLLTILDKSLLRSPIFLSTFLGVFFSATEMPLPVILSSTLELLAPATVPVALFCLGASLEFRTLKQSKAELLWLVVVKLVVHPLLTLLIFKAAGLDDQNWILAAVFLAALPTGALAHVMALRYDVKEKETSLTVVLSTLAALVSVSFWVTLLN
ncbi:AEC family transporter [Neptuniibacter sp.]|uniref:AEC family transporter n=1 Tax=Neptuniibacter sp. TaxID=1962643 RepID=UPI00261BEBED|nr:AEC family transporter [Neptuniibacter sp.]MCP4598846.1 AEC family transporter [Neptuniibacter sp.]